MHFSSRTSFGVESDPLTEAAAQRRAAGQRTIDLSESNPTRCGLGLPSEIVLPGLADRSSLQYQAEPLGPFAGRQAVAELYYQPRGIALDPANLLLTTSTSEAYSFLFCLFCEPGDHVLVPQPSYPLFDLLARLDDVETRTYPLRFQDRWEIDLSALEAAIDGRTRAIVVVHPNNPTGHYASSAEQAALDDLAARYGLPLLVDEVFLDYPVEVGPGENALRSFAARSGTKTLTFVMSGLSKVLALPQMKLAWTAVLGPEHLRREALFRLEFIADTFLSVGAPVAHAAGQWLPHAAQVQNEVLARVRDNLNWLDGALAQHGLVNRLPVEAGWAAVLRLPAVEPDAVFALNLLKDAGVLVHPGSFFGMPARGWLLVSLLPEPALFQQGIAALLAAVSRSVHVAAEEQ